jgi:hypothetical protein
MEIGGTIMENERHKIYEEFVQIVFDTMYLTKSGKGNSTKAEKLGQRMQLVGLKLMLSAPDKIVKGYITWRAIAMQGDDTEGIFKSFSNLIILMRDDLREGVASEMTAMDVMDIMT